jgi:hypothetical protein
MPSSWAREDPDDDDDGGGIVPFAPQPKWTEEKRDGPSPPPRSFWVKWRRRDIVLVPAAEASGSGQFVDERNSTDDDDPPPPPR